MARLDIRLFGNFRLLYDGAPVTRLNSPRLQALVAYLALRRDVPIPRHQLAFLLWPGSEEAKAFNSLRVALHTLRQTLPQAADYLAVDAMHVQLRTTSTVSLDVANFENAVVEAETAVDEVIARHTWQRAVALYTDDLLPGIYDDWIQPHRERLRQMLITALDRLADGLERAGDYRAAIAQTERLLLHESLREDMYRRLMRLHALNGDRASIQRVYLTCTAVLERELGIEPGQATREAYVQLLGDGAIQTQTDGRPGSPAPANLPRPVTSFTGRVKEIVAVQHVLAAHRLVTLTGPGGCGKTRLALQVAGNLVEERQFADGVWWIELTGLTDPGLVPQAVATVLQVREQASLSLIATLSEALQRKHLLLVLDNCEHLIGACSSLADTLLRACPNLSILATSREPLGVAEGIIWIVPPLALPDQDSTLPTPPVIKTISTAHSAGQSAPHDILRITQYDAIRLFITRAVDTLPTFRLTTSNMAAVVEVCRRLDGLPLAIELAAARVKLLSVEQIARRLDDTFHLLTRGGAPVVPRHQTLRATMDWSHDLLTEPERILFRRLAVFASGFTLSMAEEVCADVDEERRTKDEDSPLADVRPSTFVPSAGSGQALRRVDMLDVLSELVDRSLVTVAPESDGASAEVRYRLLETVRQYAAERLAASGETDTLRDRHLACCLELAERAEPELRGAEQSTWAQRLENEHDNLRVALQRAHDNRATEVGLRLAVALGYFWSIRGYYSEGCNWVEAFLQQPTSSLVAPTVRAMAYLRAGWLKYRHGDLSQAYALAETSLNAFRALDNIAGAARALDLLGALTDELGDPSRAQSMQEVALALYQQVGEIRGIATALGNLGLNTLRQGQYRRALTLLEECLPLRRQLGDKTLIGMCLTNISLAALYLGDYARARTAALEGLALAREIGDRHIQMLALNNLGVVTRYQADNITSADLHAQSLALARDLGDPRYIALGMWNLGELARIAGQLAEALALFEQARTLYLSVGADSGAVLARRGLAMTLSALDDWTRAKALYIENLTMPRTDGNRWQVAETLEGLAAVAAASSDPRRAALYLAQAAYIRAHLETPPDPTERAWLDPLDSQVRAALGDDAWADAWAEGQAMAIEQVVDYALMTGREQG